MPIQFRCGSCQQLLGIARRKAGMIVDCPTCNQKTRVPIVKEKAASAEPAGIQPPSIFDRVDVDKLLSPPHRTQKREMDPPSMPPSRKSVHDSDGNGRVVDPLEDPKEMPRFDKPQAGIDAIGDQPFTLTPVPVLRTAQTRKKLGTIVALVIALVLVVGGVFALGHWLGARHPLF